MLDKTKVDLSSLSVEQKTQVSKLIQDIFRVMAENPDGEFTHNIIGGSLRQISIVANHSIANAVIEQLGITEKYGIEKVTLPNNQEVR